MNLRRDGLRTDQPPSDFVVLVIPAGGDVTVAVHGEIDLETAPLLWDRLDETIPEVQGRLVIDLAGCPFLDSCGLAVFVRAFKRLRHLGCDLAIRAPGPSPRKVLKLTGLDAVIPIED